MATLKAQVEAYIGTTSAAEDTAMAKFLATSANWLIDILPVGMWGDEQAYEATVSAVTGLDVNGMRVLYVKSGTLGERCRKILPSQIGEATRSTSLLKATTLDPVFYVHSDTLYISEGGAAVAGTAYRISHLLDTNITVASDTAITGLPTRAVQLAVLNAAILVLAYRLQTKLDSLAALSAPTLSITATAPTALSAPSFTAVTATDFPNGASYVAITAPSALSISAQYTELDTDLDTEEDVELALAKIQEIKTRIEEWNTTSTEALARLRADKELKGSLSAQYYSAVLQKDIQQYDGTVKRFAQELGLYESNIRRGLDNYRLDIEKYNAQMQQESAEYKAVIGQIAILRKTFEDMAKTMLGINLSPIQGEAN